MDVLFSGGDAAARWSGPMRARLKDRDARRREARTDVREELAFNAEMRARAGRYRTSPPSLEDELVQLADTRDRGRRWRRLPGELGYDLTDAIRRLRRAPAFTAGVVGILAVGLGANSAVVRVANDAFLRPLPFAKADRLVRVQEYSRASDGTIRWTDASSPSLEAMQASGAFSVAAALNPLFTALVGAREPQRLSVGAVTAGWWTAVGVRPAVGRLFTPAEEAAGDGAGVVLISDQLWHTRFGGRATALGATLSVDSSVRTIIGVMPPGYRFPYDEDAWWPMRITTPQRGFFLAGRLADGVTLDLANQKLDAAGPSLVGAYPILRGQLPRARRFRDVLVGDDGRVVLVLTWAVALLLLIVATNVTMLFLTRLVSRERELAVRAALGCGRARQIRHLMIEAWLLFLAGGAIGLGLSALAERALLVLVPHVLVEQAAMASLPADVRVLGMTVAIVVVCGTLVGLGAAWRAPTVDLTEALRATARAGASTSGRRALGGLVIVELALAAVLLSTAVTVASGLRQLEARDVGFRTDNLLTWHLELGAPRLQSAAAHMALVERIESRIGPLGGPTGVGMSTVNPLCCADWGSRVAVEGQPVTPLTANTVNWRLVTPSFFRTLGVPVLAGRPFDKHDTVSSEPVAIVDERFARRYWPGANANAIGQRIKRGSTDSAFPWLRVVGVVSAIEDAGDYTETWYVPYLQEPAGASTEDLHVWIRTADVTATSAAVRTAMRGIDPALPVNDLRLMEEVKQTALTQRRHATVVAASFGAAGVILALSGVYALVAFVVARERRDIGVRLALGATGAGVLRQVVGRLVRLSSMGVLIGCMVARWVEPLVVRALGARPLGFWLPAALVATLLLVASIVAAWLPARRVLALDPVRALMEA
jgi:putative ABC transport system permease protein